MGELIASAIDGWFAENDILSVHPQAFCQLLGAGEPHEVYDARTVGEMGNDAFLPRPHVELLETQDIPFQLDIGHLAGKIANGVDVAAVHIFIRIILQQVAKRFHAQLLLQDVLPMGADTWYELDVLLKYIEHSQFFCLSMASATRRSKGVVILMFSRLPSTRVMSCPNASTTEASSVNISV